MTLKRFGKKLLKITGITVGILLVLLTAFHFWFVAHARELLENLVSSKSHGKLKLKAEKFKFSYFSTKMELEKAVFFNTDTIKGSTAYRFSVERIRLQANSILPIIFKKEILIDSLTLVNPDIVITRLKIPDKNDTLSKQDVSIPQEMGKIYHSIQDAISVLKMKRFDMENASFTLVNKTKPAELPVTITRLFFHMNNIEVDSSNMTLDQKILFGENLVLRTRNQDILFPDGRHRLSFSRFRINMRKKLVEFDSCTIAATKGDNSSASFKVFFDALLLTNIDFDTLYRHDVIKADSVYCVNPRFKLEVDLEKKSGPKKPPPQLDKIIQQLTGNLLLGFVIVNNAAIDITTYRKNKPSSFTSDHNNFEMQGLSINQGREKPLQIKSFAMAIRNYENFLRDSSYSMQFDSILFNNDRILLSNFKLRQLDQGRVMNSFSMPQFELRGLSWDELVFNRKLKAYGATLYHPLINYTIEGKPKNKNEKLSIFNSLAAIGNIMHLEELNIVDGKVDLLLKDKTELHLQNASVSVQSRSLFNARKISGIRDAVNKVEFGSGAIQTHDISIQLEKALYNGKTGELTAGRMSVANRQKTIAAQAQHITIHDLVTDENTGDIQASGIQWTKADIKINASKTQAAKKPFQSTIILKNINGKNTNLEAVFGDKIVTTFLQTVTTDELLKLPGKKPETKNLVAMGQHLQLTGRASLLTVEDYSIADLKNSTFSNISYTNTNKQDSIFVTVPSFSVIPDLKALLNEKYFLKELIITSPLVKIKIADRGNAQAKKPAMLPQVDIDKINITAPLVQYSQSGSKGNTNFDWNGLGGNNNFLELTGIRSGAIPGGGIELKQTQLVLDHFSITGRKGKAFQSGKLEIKATLNNTKLNQKENGDWDWLTLARTVNAKNIEIENIGKSSGKLEIDGFDLENISLNAASLKKPALIIDESPAFQLTGLTGRFNSTKNHVSWKNAAYNQATRVLTTDAFNFHPLADSDVFVAAHHYQTDYIKASSGPIKITGLDPSLYWKDSIIKIGNIIIDNGFVSDFLDMRHPFRAGIIKSLPTKLVKKIPLKLSVDSILLNDASTIYSEWDEKAAQPGIIPVTRMTIRIFPFKNINLEPTDSLKIQVNGYLMDSIWVRLRIRESYADSLSGFLMTVRMKPGNLLLLNPVFMPLSSVKLLSGRLDTLTMRAVAKEYFSYGEMKMFYHDLKIKFLTRGEETKKRFLTGLKTFVANSFVIKNKNTSRAGRVFYLRNRERSVLNYIVKIPMSGIASSVGAKSNRKVLRKYKKELRIRNLPPFDFD